MSKTTKRRKGAGRPPLPKGQAKYTPVMFRVNPSFHRALVAAAKRQNKSVPTFIRDCLEDALGRERK
jgi:predicted HicB family RNase H-like nuclease